LTHEEAVAEITAYKNSVQLLFLLVATESMKFGIAGAEVEKALSLSEGALARALLEVRLLEVFSAYLTVLENATKGQLAPVTIDDEWSDTIG